MRGIKEKKNIIFVYNFFFLPDYFIEEKKNLRNKLIERALSLGEATCSERDTI